MKNRGKMPDEGNSESPNSIVSLCKSWRDLLINVHKIEERMTV